MTTGGVAPHDAAPRPAPAVDVGLVAGAAAYLVWTLATPVGDAIPDLTLGSAVLVAAVVAVARRAAAGGPDATAWRALALAGTAWCVSEVAVDVAERLSGGGVSDVSGLEVGYVVGYLAAVAGTARFVWSGAARWSVGHVAQAVGASLLVAALVLLLVRPLVDLGGSAPGLVPAWTVLPVLDAFLLAGTLVVARSARGAWWFLPGWAGGLLLGDVVFSAAALLGRYSPGLGHDVASTTGWVALALAARHARGHAGERRRTRASLLLTPTALLPASLLLLLLDQVADLGRAVVWLAAGAAAAAVHVAVGQTELTELAVLRREASTDDLTGAANRRALLAEVDRRHRRGHPFALALLDLDRFKEVNDDLGHAAGDELLRQVVLRLTASAPEGAFTARVGGDEFAVLLPDHDRGPALGHARRLHGVVSGDYSLLGHRVHVGASVGVAVHGHDATGASALLRCADLAMYEGKTLGGGVTAYHGGGSGQGTLERVTALRSALRVPGTPVDPGAGRVVVHYQPQVRTGDGVVVGVEALVRWWRPGPGLLGPDRFLDDAERHGLVGHLAHRVLDDALAAAATWEPGPTGEPLRVAVNLSATNLLDPDLPGRVADLLTVHGLTPDRLELEITESVLVSRSPRTRAVLDALAALGVDLSIDDFGTGYSSLSYLRELDVAEIKLDRSFVVGIATDERSAAIVASTVWLGHRLGVRIVGEGVEDTGTEAALAAAGCDVSQGYLHSRPLPADQLAQWLAAHRAEARTAT